MLSRLPSMPENRMARLTLLSQGILNKQVFWRICLDDVHWNRPEKKRQNIVQNIVANLVSADLIIANLKEQLC